MKMYMWKNINKNYDIFLKLCQQIKTGSGDQCHVL